MIEKVQFDIENGLNLRQTCLKPRQITLRLEISEKNFLDHPVLMFPPIKEK